METTEIDTTPLKQNEWLSPKDFAQEFDISEVTQSKMRAAGKLPYSKLGKFVRYNRAKINELLKNAEVVR